VVTGLRSGPPDSEVWRAPLGGYRLEAGLASAEEAIAALVEPTGDEMWVPSVIAH
jgi:hypothetical protein